MRQIKIGLALGAGSAKGWAHIGVINALKKLGIEVDIVAGCSVGALVGA
ncbi:patatin-like phospholipase family protein, partial [Serratia ureilytica]